MGFRVPEHRESKTRCSPKILKPPNRSDPPKALAAAAHRNTQTFKPYQDIPCDTYISKLTTLLKPRTLQVHPKSLFDGCLLGSLPGAQMIWFVGLHF